jgi:hypothetical protein
VSSVHPGARDATHAAIVNPGTPIVRVDELGERFAACPGGAFHMDKAGPELEIGFGDFEHLMASLFAFSATFEICRDVGRANAKIADESGIP